MKITSFQEHVQHQFDAYCKKVLKRAAHDIYREIAKQATREISLSDISEAPFVQLSYADEYFTDAQQFKVLDFVVSVSDELLAEAIAMLPEDKQKIILLSYFLGMNDREIGEVLNLIRATVQHRRTSSLKQLKQFLGVKAMARKNNNRLLPYTVILAATRGDTEAMQTVFSHYAGYIAKLSMRPFYGENGCPHVHMDEGLRRRLENKLIAAILKFKAM